MSLSNAAAKVADEMLGKRQVAQHSTQPDVSSCETMKAIVWKSAKQVACELKPVPRVTHPKDVVVRVTQCTVCSGSDSHIYSGEIATTDEGLILGHEACGVVHQVGPEVTKFKQGDRVVIAFDIACGECARCQRQEFTGCDRTNDSRLFEEMYGGPAAAAIYGYSRLMGNVPGSQAEFVRVPFAEVNCYPIPDSVPDEKALFVSDVLSTALHAVEMGCVREGDSVAIWGLGPIGLYAAAWAKIKGAGRVIGIDLVPERLQLARDQFGLEVLDRSDLSSAQVLSKLRDLLPQGGVDVAIDATGFRFSQSWTSSVERALGMQSDTPDILVECMSLVRKFGHVSIIADYIGYANHFPIGHIMMKHLTVRSGQCPVQRYFKYVMDKLEQGAIDPTPMITHRISLEDVPRAYEQLFYKKEGYIKVLITVPDSRQQSQQRGQEGHGVGSTLRQAGDKAQQYGQGMQEKYGVSGQQQQQQKEGPFQGQFGQAQQQAMGGGEHYHPHPSQHESAQHVQQGNRQGDTSRQEMGSQPQQQSLRGSHQETHQQGEQQQQQQQEKPSMLTRAMQAMKMTGPSEPQQEQQQPRGGGGGQTQQTHESNAQQKAPFTNEQQREEQYGQGQRLQSDEPTRAHQPTAYRGAP
jgi:threonine dehydrogenase-like Zn-dependent dehydrogenase